MLFNVDYLLQQKTNTQCGQIGYKFMERYFELFYAKNGPINYSGKFSKRESNFLKRKNIS